MELRDDWQLYGAQRWPAIRAESWRDMLRTELRDSWLATRGFNYKIVAAGVLLVNAGKGQSVIGYLMIVPRRLYFPALQ